MPKPAMSDMLKKRMAATQQASELQVGDEAYKVLFQTTPTATQPIIRDLPIERLRPFFTADIGFKPYPPAKLKAFSEQLASEGLYERIIVRSIPHSEDFEIIAGHNRTEGGKLAGWDAIPAEIIEADDNRATSIAISTNLLRRQNLTIIERGKAYKALLDANNRHGQRNAMQAKTTFGDNRQKFSPKENEETFGDNRQRYNIRKLVAEFFGVTEYEIRKAVKLTCLIPPLQDVLEVSPRQLNLACAELIADYDAPSQAAFVEICSIEGYQLNKAAMRHIIEKCPPPAAEKHLIFTAWREARAAAEKRMAAPPKKITFDRRKFAPYLEKLGSDAQLEDLFLEFLQSRVG